VSEFTNLQYAPNEEQSMSEDLPDDKEFTESEASMYFENGDEDFNHNRGK